jgi:hypothetical protein
LAHRAYPALPKNQVRREAGRAFANGVGDPATKMHLLLKQEISENNRLQNVYKINFILCRKLLE